MAVETGGPEFWPWWQGAAALGFVSIAFWLVVGAPLGVSSSWDRIVHWRREREHARTERRLQANQDMLSEAMLAETIAQFGREAVEQMLKTSGQPAPAPAAGKKSANPMQRAPWPAHVTFLIAMAAGGALASFLGGDLRLEIGMGAEFARLFGSGPHIWLVLLAGGFLIGFGTRMSGGCTSGHGLSGCGWFQPGSLVGTVSFFAAAVATSFFLEMLV